MHPDEATEPIVDAALRARTPFAVVPCCVFSRIFQHRRLSNGQAVTTHEQFCEYLRQKAPAHIRTCRLPFHGKSTVVYSLGCEPQPAPLDAGVACRACAEEET